MSRTQSARKTDASAAAAATGSAVLLKRVERRDDDADRREEEEAEGQGGEDSGGCERVGGAETASLEEDPNDRRLEQDQPDARRDRHERDEAKGESEVVLERAAVRLQRLLREKRQDRGRDRDREAAENELLQPIGVVEMGHARVAEPRGEARRDDRVEGADAVRPQPGRHEGEDRTHGRILPAQHRRAHGPKPRELRNLDGDLEEAADENSRREAVGRLGEAGREEERREDQRDVQEDGRGRGGREAPVRVQDRLAERRERDEEDVGKDPAAEDDRQLELPRRLAELPGEKGDEPGRDQDARPR